MTAPEWDTSLIGVDPARHARSVLVVPGAGAAADPDVLDELRRWGWTVTVADPQGGLDGLAAAASRHDVAWFTDIGGTRAARRALTAVLPTVAAVPPRRRGRLARLVGETGTRRDTTVLIVHDPRDAKILRRLSASALMRPETTGSVRGRATALAAVLLRARAWQPVPRPVAAAP